MPKWSHSALICTLVNPKELPQDIKQTESEWLVHLMFISKPTLKKMKDGKLSNSSAELALKMCHPYTPSSIAGSVMKEETIQLRTEEKKTVWQGCAKRISCIYDWLPKGPTPVCWGSTRKCFVRDTPGWGAGGITGKMMVEAEDKSHLNNWLRVTAPWGTSVPPKAQRPVCVPSLCQQARKMWVPLPGAGLYEILGETSPNHIGAAQPFHINISHKA